VAPASGTSELHGFCRLSHATRTQQVVALVGDGSMLGEGFTGHDAPGSAENNVPDAVIMTVSDAE